MFQIAAGTKHSVALAKDGSVHVWGADCLPMVSEPGAWVLDECTPLPARIPKDMFRACGISDCIRLISAGGNQTLLV
jgi:hypothetical protein